MKALLVDLARHQSWADAEYWLALEKCPPAMADDAIRRRLHHLHLVQRIFLWLVQRKEPSTFPMTTPQDFPSFDALRDYSQGASRSMTAFVDDVSEQQLGERVQMPWLQRDPPFSITSAEALMQAMMHSQWHRGQNATRLRELGGAPPTIDLIIWYMNDRPAAVCDDSR
jgi:uncharacterized damage-inducible protein DinB